jgi:hypothetical protein
LSFAKQFCLGPYRPHQRQQNVESRTPPKHSNCRIYMT